MSIADRIAALRVQVALLLQQLALALNNRPISMEGSTIYQKAAQSLGKHMTLDNTVPAEVGCAEAVSAVLALAGVSDGAHGIAGTATLYGWLSTSPKFKRILVPEQGAIIVSPTGAGNGLVVGHTGIFGLYNKEFPNDWGILSNDSATGLFLERWSWAKWQDYYGKTGNLPLYIFSAV